MKGITWSSIFWKYIRKGHDRSTAAYEADRWFNQRPATLSRSSENRNG